MARRVSRNKLNGKIERLSRGVAIYRVHASPFWQARIWDARASGYKTQSTKEKGKLAARLVAEEIALSLKDANRAAPIEYSFKSYAARTTAKLRQKAETGELNKNYV